MDAEVAFGSEGALGTQLDDADWLVDVAAHYANRFDEIGIV